MNFSCKLVLLVSTILFHCEVNSTSLTEDDDGVTERNLNNFGTMVECETKRDKWKYNGYGCWCGYGGQGTPIDETDRCCYEHDKCYDRLIHGNECTTSVDPYLVSYKFSNCSVCATANDYRIWDWLGWTTVACRVAICACDSAAAKCFARNVYNNAYASYDKTKCGMSTNA